MSNVSATKSWGRWKSPPTPSLDNGNWNKNPQEFFGIFDTLIDRCTLVVWAVTNSRNRNNWRSTSVTHLPNVLTTIVHFAKQPPRDVYFLRQTHKSKQNNSYIISQSYDHSFITNGELYFHYSFIQKKNIIFVNKISQFHICNQQQICTFITHYFNGDGGGSYCQQRGKLFPIEKCTHSFSARGGESCLRNFLSFLNSL